MLQGDVMAQGVEYLLLPRREAMKKGHQVVEQVEARFLPSPALRCAGRGYGFPCSPCLFCS